jgi:pyruvate/2-oxoglutarate dehydrogenase complex dihydrolipoamide acyltransferase (E2) component
VRGGLDDALDKLARRDELRRRAAGEATGTPPAVQELVEAIAAVVGRNPTLGVTVGVEGAGDPTLLHFFVEDGTVQVSVDRSVASRVSQAAESDPKHADFDIDLDDPVEPAPAADAYPPAAATGEETRRISYDDRDRYDPGTGYGATAYDEPNPYSRAETNGHHGPARDSAFPTADTAAPDNPYLSPFAATPPPPVPPQTTRRIRPEQYRAPEEPSAAERRRRQAAPEQRATPQPLPEPIPLKVDSEETEMAAKRLAALLRDNPTLLRPGPPD